MATPRPQSGVYGSVPPPNDPSHLNKGYGGGAGPDIDANDFANTPANPQDLSPLSQSLGNQGSQRLGRFQETFDARTRGESVLYDGDGELPQRSASRASTLNQGSAPSRSGTLKKKASVRRSQSLKRSGSRRSQHAGSIRGVQLDDDDTHVSSKHNNVFYTPVPTSGSPTEILANRFQAWRKFLKDLITYFREISNSYESRSKGLLKVSNVINNTNAPSMFMTEGGINDANRILRDFHKQVLSEAHKAKDIESEVINQLSGLRADLGQKIKEIKSLSGDFKNSVEKEKENTRKCVDALTNSLALVDSDPSAVAGKGDPYVVRLGVDRQVERQIDEENYLHRAYLNLENSGRELESIVVGEIQKAYNALANIMKRDADEQYSTIEKLRNGPIGMPRDVEWNQFVLNDPHFVNPNIPLRRLEDIEYPGKHHPATTEVRAGMLERKSKYLKSYTPGWYVLSPTHLHEFKSADRIYTQPPVMSLYLPDQKLGSHSQPGSSSHKFVLKGRQTGSMHRGHSWVFRAESYDTMLAWYEDIKTLTEKTGEERNAFVRKHARSVSQSSARSVSSDGGFEDDEADEVPYSANQSMTNAAVSDERPARPSPGGRFPSDLQVERSLQAPLSPSSGSSDVAGDLTTASGGLQGTYPPQPNEPTSYGQSQQQKVAPQQSQNNYQYPQESSNAYQQYQQPPPTQQQPPVQNQTPYYSNPAPSAYNPTPTQYAPQQQPTSFDPPPVQRHESTYGDWMAPAAGGVAAGALGTEAYRHHQQTKQLELAQEQQRQRELEQERQQRQLEQQETLPLHHNPSITQHDGPVIATQTATIPANLPSSGPPSAGTFSTLPSSTDEQPFLGNADATVLPAPVTSKATNGGVAGMGLTSAEQYEAKDQVHETGRVFPGVVRHNTDISVSDLHVPGEYPRLSPR